MGGLSAALIDGIQDRGKRSWAACSLLLFSALPSDNSYGFPAASAAETNSNTQTALELQAIARLWSTVIVKGCTKRKRWLETFAQRMHCRHVFPSRIKRDQYRPTVQASKPFFCSEAGSEPLSQSCHE